MNGHEGSWLEAWVDEFLAQCPPGWPFEEESAEKSEDAAAWSPTEPKRARFTDVA